MANANTRVIVQDDPNSPVKIVVPAPKRVAEIIKAKGSFSMDDIKGAHKEASNFCECDASELPTDRTFRNAWDLDADASDPTYSGKRVKLNKAKGQQIAKDRVHRS